jgi:hypothetical protein
MKNILYFFITLTLFLFAGCKDDKAYETESVKSKSQILLDKFVNKKYDYVYQLRDEKFKSEVGYEIYINYIEQVESYLSLREPVIGGVVVDNNLILVSFSYEFSIDNESWKKTRDFLVWEINDDELHCLDSGFRLFFSLNASLYRPLPYEKYLYKKGQ